MQTEAVQAQIVALRKQLVNFGNYIAIGSGLSGEDLAQEAIAKALTTPRDLTDENISSYMYRCVRNVFISINKREARKASLNGVSFDSDGDAQGISHDQAIADMLSSPSAEDVILGDLSPEMKAALATLHPGIRETFLLIVVQGMSYLECAEYQNISTGTVMSRVSRAKKHLQKALVSA